jgi:hypothetical protein
MNPKQSVVLTASAWRALPAAGFLFLISIQPQAGRAGTVDEARLWYRQPAQQWKEALFIGNSRMGGAVWGGPQRERIDLNEDTLWSGEPYENLNTNGLKALPEIRRLLLTGHELEAQRMVNKNMNGHYVEDYLALGDLEMEFPGQAAATGYERELDLNRAVVRETYTAEGVRYTREIFASHPADVIVIHLTADKPGRISFTAKMGSQIRSQMGAGENCLRLTGQAPIHEDAHLVNKPVWRRRASGRDSFRGAVDGAEPRRRRALCRRRLGGGKLRRSHAAAGRPHQF